MDKMKNWIGKNKKFIGFALAAIVGYLGAQFGMPEDAQQTLLGALDTILSLFQ